MKENNSLQRNLTEGSITKNLLTYAWPLMIANTLQAVYNIVDMLVVGRVEGQIGLAAVSVGTDILHLVMSLLIGFCGAGQVLISQSVGADEKEHTSRLVGTLYTLVFIFSVCISLFCLFAADWLLGLLNTPQEAYAEAKAYFLTCSVAGTVFMSGYNATCSILRGMGNSKQPFIFIAIASVLNMILDVVFVKYLGMGAFGAALATVIGQTVSFVTAIIYLYRNKEQFGFDFKLSSFRINKRAKDSLIKLGIPMSIQMASINLSKMFLSRWINACGVVYTALAGVYNKVSLIINIMGNSITAAGSTMVGQNIGARKYDRVQKTLMIVLLFAAVISAVFAAFVIIYPAALFEMFTTDQSVIALAPIMTLPFVINFIGVTGRCYAFSLINGSGNSKLNLLVAILDGIVARLFFAYYFGFVVGLSAQGFWLGDAIAGNIPFFIGLFFFLSGKWKKRSS